MKFTVDVVSHCDANNLLINNPTVKLLIEQQNQQTNKQIISLFFCVCCCVANSNNSVLLLHANRLGFAPKELRTSTNSSGHIVISYAGKNAHGQTEKIPLLFCGNVNLAKIVLKELDQIYIKSSRMNAVFDTLDLHELDAQAAIWNQLFGLPTKSRGTQELETDAEDADFQEQYEAECTRQLKQGGTALPTSIDLPPCARMAQF